MSLSDISNILWQERQLLDLLLFKLEEEQLLLTTGRSHWLNHATNEIEMIIEQLKGTELLRAIMIYSVVEFLDLPSSPSLREIVLATPHPWKSILDEHRCAFLEIMQEVNVLAQENREILTKGYESAREALSWLGLNDNDSGEIKKPAGSDNTGVTNRDLDLPATILQSKVLDATYQTALSATDRVLQPSLMDFLN